MARKKPDNDMLDDRDDDEIIDMVPMDRLPPPPPPSFSEPSTEAERRTEDLWERLLGSDEHGTGYINVTRVTGTGNTSEEFVQKFPADQYDYEDLLDHLRETYGPGAYRIRLYVKGNNGRFSLRGNRLATIAKPLPGSAVPSIREAARSGQDMPAILATFEAMQQRSQQQMAELIDRIERRNAQPTRSPALEMAETMQAMMTAMAPMFAMLKSNSAPPQTDPLDMLTKVMALQKQLQPAGVVEREESGTDWMGVLKEGIKALPVILSERNNQARAALPHRPPQPAPRRPVAPTFPPVDEAPPQPAVPQAESGEVVPVDRSKGNRLHPLHDNLCDLLNAASACEANGEPTPDQVAEMMVQQMQPEQRPLFRQFLESPTLLKDLNAIHPDAIDHAEWLLDLRDEVIERLDLIDGVNEGYDQGSDSLDAEASNDAGINGQADQPTQTA